MKNAEVNQIDLTGHNAAEIGCELIMSLIAPILGDILDGDTPTEIMEQVYAGMIGAMYGEMVSRFGHERASDLLTRSLKAAQTMPKEWFFNRRH